MTRADKTTFAHEVAKRGTAGWWFLDLGYCWLAFRAENE
jgi:hypothetical protein